MGPSSLFFLAKIRTEILVLDGFRRILSGVWILTVGPSSSFFRKNSHRDFGFGRISEDFVRGVDLNSWSVLLFFRKNSHRDFGFGRICWGYGILTVGPSSPLFLAKIRTEILVLEGFVGVVDLNSWSPSSLSFSSQKFAPRFWFWTDFVRFALNSLCC